MSMVNIQVDPQIDADAIYAHIIYIDNVCKFLSANDLRNFAQVCKSWRDSAMREISKRHYIHHLHFNYDFYSLPSLNRPPTSELIFEPQLSLLFYDRRLMYQVINMGDGRYKRMGDHFRYMIPNGLMMLGVKEYLTAADVAHEDTFSRLNSNILGLFIPNVDQRAHVRMACLRRAASSNQTTVDYLIENLGFLADDFSKRPTCTVLFFALGNKGLFFAERVVETLRHIFKDSKDTIWGAYFGNGLLRATHNLMTYRSSKSLVALRIEGSKVESWTTIISSRWPRDEIEQKLYKLKEKVTPGRRCNGLLCGPCGRDVRSRKNGIDNQETVMRILKLIFPSILFVGLFDDKCKSWTTDGNTNYVDKEEFVPIIITSYN